ncbi:hypothetical protein VX159_05950 [Dechloromonas sp. ZY10]
MSSTHQREKFKVEAVKQVTDRRHPASEGVNWLGVSLPTLYEWLKRYSLPEAKQSDFNCVQHPQCQSSFSIAFATGSTNLKTGCGVEFGQHQSGHFVDQAIERCASAFGKCVQSLMLLIG